MKAMSELTEAIRALINYYKISKKLLDLDQKLIQMLLYLLNRYEENEK